jgi:hypothetical protein
LLLAIEAPPAKEAFVFVPWSNVVFFGVEKVLAEIAIVHRALQRSQISLYRSVAYFSMLPIFCSEQSLLGRLAFLH